MSERTDEPSPQSSPLPYIAFQSALLLGEADFSFTHAFSKVFQGCITATEYLSGTEIVDIYYDNNPTFLSNLSTRSNVQHILCCVDAKQLADDECRCVPFNGSTNAFHSSSVDLWNLMASTQTPPIDLVIFNCPHTEKFGKAPKLLKRMFEALEDCILLKRGSSSSSSSSSSDNQRVSNNCVVELRLRDLSKVRKGRVRVDYEQEQAASASNFRLIGVYDNDVANFWEKLDYRHCITGQNRSCRGLPCRVWRFQYQKQPGT